MSKNNPEQKKEEETKPVGNLSPHFYAICTIATGLCGYLFFSHYELQDKYYFVPVFVLAIALGIGNLYQQVRGNSVFRMAKAEDRKGLLKRATARYLVWLAVFTIGYLFLQTHPFYSSIRYQRSLDFLAFYYQMYLYGGFPYFVVTLLVKSSRIEDYYDPAVRIIQIVKSIAVRTYGGADGKLLVLKKSYNRKVLLNLVLRGYFVPIMVVQIYNLLEMAMQQSAGHFHNYNIVSMLLFSMSILWLMDATLASMSYSIESRWLENRSRSLDMTVGRWLICLSCYAPLNDATGTLFPFGPSVIEHNSSLLLISNNYVLYAGLIAENIILFFLVYADSSLGPSGANLSLKKLQTKGIYALVRHPGYTLKVMMWWMASMLYVKFWSAKYIFGQLMWTLIYIARAITEERHLKKFPEYREYMQKVRYRFFPWLF